MHRVYQADLDRREVELGLRERRYISLTREGEIHGSVVFPTFENPANGGHVPHSRPDTYAGRDVIPGEIFLEIPQEQNRVSCCVGKSLSFVEGYKRNGGSEEFQFVMSRSLARGLLTEKPLSVLVCRRGDTIHFDPCMGSYERNENALGFLFERRVTKCSTHDLSLKSLQVISLGETSILMSSEVDAVDSMGNPIEIKTVQKGKWYIYKQMSAALQCVLGGTRKMVLAEIGSVGEAGAVIDSVHEFSLFGEKCPTCGKCSNGDEDSRRSGKPLYVSREFMPLVTMSDVNRSLSLLRGILVWVRENLPRGDETFLLSKEFGNFDWRYSLSLRSSSPAAPSSPSLRVSPGFRSRAPSSPSSRGSSGRRSRAPSSPSSKLRDFPAQQEPS